MKRNNQLNFLIADDHSIVRQGVSIVIGDVFVNSNIYHASSISDTMKHVRSIRLDLIVLDISFSEGNTLELVKYIKDVNPDVKILIFSAHDENIYGVRYLKQGADGYIDKGCSDDQFISAIKSVLLNGRYTSKQLGDRILNSYLLKKNQNPFEILSNRELQISSLLIEGCSNGEISEKLNLSRTTISTYKLRLFEKLSINSVAELIQLNNLYS